MVKNSRGVTLAELLIVVLILGLLAMLGPSILTQATKVFILGRAKLELQREARATMYILTRELRQAQSATISISEAAGQGFYSRISFTKIPPPSGGTGAAVTIYQQGSSIILTEGTTSSTLSKHLQYVAFTFPHSDDMTIVSVSMTLQEQIYGGAVKALHMASERVRVMD